MKVLVFGPSGSGKTYVSKALKLVGMNAFDAEDIDGLSNWYQNGKKVAAPTTADETLNGRYAFLWSKKVMAAFLARYDTVYVFGGSGNIASVFELFDRIYFLKIDPDLQRERLRSPDRSTPQMDINEGELVVWGDWLEQFAAKQNIPFVDASQTPEQICQIISQE